MVLTVEINLVVPLFFLFFFIWKILLIYNTHYGVQNPANKRQINCDEKLKAIFDGRENVGILEIGKLLSAHFVKSSS